MNSFLLISASLRMILRLSLFFIYLDFLTNASVTVTAGWHNILKDNFVSRVMQHLTTHVNFEFPHWHDIVKASFAPITKNCTSIVNSTMIVSISVIYMSLPRRNLSPSMLVSVTPSQAPLLAPILAPCWQANPSSLSLITLPLRAPLRASTLDQCCCGRFVSLAIKSPSQRLKEALANKSIEGHNTGLQSRPKLHVCHCWCYECQH